MTSDLPATAVPPSAFPTGKVLSVGWHLELDTAPPPSLPLLKPPPPAHVLCPSSTSCGSLSGGCGRLYRLAPAAPRLTTCSRAFHILVSSVGASGTESLSGVMETSGHDRLIPLSRRLKAECPSLQAHPVSILLLHCLLLILLPQRPTRRYDRPVPARLTYTVLALKSRAPCMLGKSSTQPQCPP